jgi:hypothetical protein
MNLLMNVSVTGGKVEATGVEAVPHSLEQIPR